MSFSDIFKKSFLEGYISTEISPKTIAVTLAITALFALYLFFVYRVFSRKTFYNKNFNMAIALIALITAAIIMTIQSSIVVSLGMVGALSIVRFRTAIKDPMDLVFLFWSISIGIICGAGLAGIALVASAITTIMLIAFEMLPIAKSSMLLVLNAKDTALENKVEEVLKSTKTSYKVKSRTFEPDRLDMIIEVRTSEEAKLVSEISKIEGITRCSLVAHDGEVTL